MLRYFVSSFSDNIMHFFLAVVQNIFGKTSLHNCYRFKKNDDIN